MPLSEEELRLLDQMERALAAEDPKFVSTIRGTSVQRAARRRAYAAGAVLVLGMGVLLLGAVMSTSPDSGTNPVGIVVGVIGFVVMVGSAYVGLTAWRSQYETPAQDDEQSSPGAEEAFGLNLIQGGKGDRGRSPRSGRSGKTPKRPRSRGSNPSSGGSFFERMEQRWQRRRDNGDF